MATQFALKKILKNDNKTSELLAYGFSEHQNSMMPAMPSAVVYLYLLYFVEYDSFISTHNDILQNNDKTAIKLAGTYEQFWGKVKLYAFPNENIIYQWILQINKCNYQSISIGVMNAAYSEVFIKKNLLFNITDDEREHWLYHTMQPFNMWLKAQIGGEELWYEAGEYQKQKKMKENDILTLQIELKGKDKQSRMRLSNNGDKLLDSKIPLRSNNEYRLYIFMYGVGDQITIKDFKTICIK